LEFEEEEPPEDIDEPIDEPEIKMTKDNYPVGNVNLFDFPPRMETFLFESQYPRHGNIFFKQIRY
jgi:hypothetical protein